MAFDDDFNEVLNLVKEDHETIEYYNGEYHTINTIDGVMPEKEPTTPDTPDTPEAPTDDSVTTQGSDGKKGCASTLAVMTAILIPVAGAILVRKRKEQNA